MTVLYAIFGFLLFVDNCGIEATTWHQGCFNLTTEENETKVQLPSIVACCESCLQQGLRRRWEDCGRTTARNGGVVTGGGDGSEMRTVTEGTKLTLSIDANLTQTWGKEESNNIIRT
ncbi:hypothetical protein LSAT2_025548 [Lamellibrachia satsuma]|nr:hypothetical protein LSAT2_025548 [Lamellibrachia satsuma]